MPQHRKMIGPSLHHHPPLRQIRRMVVRSTDRIALPVRQLQLDHIVPKAQFMRHGGRDAAKAMPCHPVLETHTLHRLQDDVVRHRLLMVALARKHQIAQAPQFMQGGQHLHCLR